MIPGRLQAKSVETREFVIDVDGARLAGSLALPPDPKGLVLFAHGSGSSRHSPRNIYVAEILQSRGIATVLFDLLTRDEESLDELTGELRFDIPFLARRLAGATRCAMNTPALKDLKIGYFGASTGAGAALVATADLPVTITAIVSRGGRPDLAAKALASVEAATLLIVGGEDKPVIAMNQKALAQLACARKKLVIVPGATHLFEEPGTLEQVAKLAADWFVAEFAAAKTGAAKSRATA